LNRPFYILFFCFFFVITSVVNLSYAQTNLIYNGDFELYDTCPTSTSSPGDDQIRFCLGWKNPTAATSDYYNGCNSWPVGYPANTFGYQYPYSGNAYCGIFIEYVAPPLSTYGYWFEYVQGNLTSNLKLGFEYEFSCRIVLSDLGWDYAFWKFGAHFSQIPISKLDGKPFTSIIPQVTNTNNNFISDTLNWLEIKGKFIAQGSESYVTIGLFSDTMNLDTLKLVAPFFDPNHFGAYYYIDACVLTETGNVYQYPNVFTPNGDGNNDEWIPFLTEGESIDIYNRWGIKVFEISKQNQKWDGRTVSGLECVDGVYYFIINSKDEKSNTIKKGFVQLIRGNTNYLQK
jgi:gliding motility-associated-like protein